MKNSNGWTWAPKPPKISVSMRVLNVFFSLFCITLKSCSWLIRALSWGNVDNKVVEKDLKNRLF
ncbi:MAG: hypothetical protein UT97_C0001G0087 [Parcubacteria group bacterium GW2011_GWC2_40_31]|nr:MAG: hypothetical protein UT83_C0001G0079 [Parcubacteria group bacterium GW2011_GWA2_40_143]KKR60516.1 MAG: hypothetical protein UT97_C0001G0087 [Parcubacteria group bacterium GW2011_GWC2_40_31]